MPQCQINADIKEFNKSYMGYSSPSIYNKGLSRYGNESHWLECVSTDVTSKALKIAICLDCDFASNTLPTTRQSLYRPHFVKFIVASKDASKAYKILQTQKHL